MASIILPNQLFSNEIKSDKKYLVEHKRYFTDFKFHKQKLILHRASMKAYNEEINAEYIQYEEDIAKIFEKEEKIKIYDPVDKKIENQIRSLSRKYEVDLEIKETPGFIASRKFNREYFSRNKKYQHSYYKEMRKREKILVDDDGNPEGGKWSFDTENREKMPKNTKQPNIPAFNSKKVEEAKEYVKNNFSENPGNTKEFIWPTERTQAKENLSDFLKNRLEKFGDFQDAFDKGIEFGFHSLLSPSLNIGLLTPEMVINKTIEAHKDRGYPLNSLEGFIRQILGWREFTRAMYQLESDMRNSNFWQNENKLPEQFYTGKTDIPPIDDSIQKAKDYAYCHHIERLMLQGNMLLLLETNPDNVYEWFMEMYIDSYDWVMVPNVYGMSQYAYQEMMTKPYISSSNYINKMSHYEDGEWQEQWDGLYWSFIKNHKEKINDIPRMSFMSSTLDRMNQETIEKHESEAEKLREKLRQTTE